MAQLEWMRYKSAFETCLTRGERLIRLLSDLPVNDPSRLSKWRSYQDLDRYYEIREASITTQHRLRFHPTVCVFLSFCRGAFRLLTYGKLAILLGLTQSFELEAVVITHSHIEEKVIGGITYKVCMPLVSR